MASGNGTRGRFQLAGIPPAPRGVPQIEVSFDIDANGILNVSATDKGTGQTQQVRIEGGSGLSEDEIQQMVKDAELNAEEDKKRRELVDLKNSAEAHIHSIRRELDEREVTDEVKTKVNEAISNLEEAIKSEDKEKINQALSDLASASQPVYESKQENADDVVDVEETK